MTDLPPHPDRGDDGGAAWRASPGTTPRWVYVAAIVMAVALIALLVGLHLSGAVGSGGH